MDVSTWLRRWLMRHPLKEPPHLERSRFTAEVMAKVKALEQPLAVMRPRVVWWRPVLVTLTAAAAVALVIGRVNQSQRTIAQDRAEPVVIAYTSEDDQWLEETLQLLEEFDGALLEDLFGEGSDADLLDELEMLVELDETLLIEPGESAEWFTPDVDAGGKVTLAESASKNELWLNEMLQLFAELDEELPEDLFEEWSDDNWLGELDTFDDTDFFTSS